MDYERERLIYRKKIRAYSKRLVTALSIVSLMWYTAALALNISSLSLYCTIVSTMISALSLALNIWSLTDHFRQCCFSKQLDTSLQDKLMKICLNITSNVSFLIGGITSILLLKFPIISFISVAFFILGCTFMATNFIRTMISQEQIDKNKISKLVII